MVEKTVVFSVAACAELSDAILAASTSEVAVIRAPLGGPAAAEGLAHRLAQRLDSELARLALDAGQPQIGWAIGVVAARRDDTGDDLLRYAQSALDDAWLLGGRRLVAFDDGDRELLPRPGDEPT